MLILFAIFLLVILFTVVLLLGFVAGVIAANEMKESEKHER